MKYIIKLYPFSSDDDDGDSLYCYIAYFSKTTEQDIGAELGPDKDPKALGIGYTMGGACKDLVTKAGIKSEDGGSVKVRIFDRPSSKPENLQ